MSINITISLITRWSYRPFLRMSLQNVSLDCHASTQYSDLAGNLFPEKRGQLSYDSVLAAARLIGAIKEILSELKRGVTQGRKGDALKNLRKKRKE